MPVRSRPEASHRELSCRDFAFRGHRGRCRGHTRIPVADVALFAGVRSAAATTRVISPSGGCTSGRSTGTRLRATPSTTSATRRRGSSPAPSPTAATPPHSGCSRRPARIGATAPRSSRRRPSPVGTRARRGGTAGGRIFRVRHRTGGTRAAGGTTSPILQHGQRPVPDVHRHRRDRPPSTDDLRTGDAVSANADPREARYDHWFDFLVHARWSTASDGFVEMWLDGKRTIRRVYGATLRNQHSPANSTLTSPGMYLSQGIYRHAYHSTNTVIHDGFRRASSRRLAAPTEH